MKASHNIFHAAGFGKVAPWVDLANSEEWNGFGKLSDHLTNPQWLATFLKHWNLHPLPSNNVPHRKLVQLRFLLRRAAEKLAAGGSLDPREISKVNQVLNVPVRQKLVQDQNGIRAETAPVRSDWNWVIARIAASLGEMLANHDVERIKVCANSDCRWVFHDPTKARTKRWCNDRTCGNRARVRRARAAQKQRA
ncbi:MAG TPA: CGNR zinc finger domain-containing protein [Candidatus Acidoferrum sp.]